MFQNARRARPAALILAISWPLWGPSPAVAQSTPAAVETAAEPAGPGAGAPENATESLPARPIVTAERLYRVGMRPRADGPVQASVADEEVARWNVGGTGDPNFPSSRSTFHPAPRVLVDIGIRSGSLPKRSKPKTVLSEARLVAQARNAGYWPFRLCYEEGLHRDPSLRGKTRVRFTVESDGKVRSEKVAFTELKDRSVGKCLAARVRTLRFSPVPPHRIHADVTIDLNPGDAPLPDSELPRSTGTDSAAAHAKVDEANASRALAEQFPKVTDCYGSGLARDSKLWGRMALALDIDTEGRIQSAAEHESRFPDRAVLACVLDSLKDVRVPQPEGGATRLVWPLRLGSPPAPEGGLNKAAVGSPPAQTKRTVAEAVPPRVPVAR